MAIFNVTPIIIYMYMANEIINSNDVQGLIISLRNQQVLLDRDVAALYGVS